MRRGGGGCLEQILELFLLTAVFNWLEDRFGFGRGASCSGCGCGVRLLVVFLFLACLILTTGGAFLGGQQGLGPLLGFV